MLPAKPGPLVLFGACDRHNLGDLLFPHIAAALLPILPFFEFQLLAESWTTLLCGGRIYRDRGPGLTETVERLKKALPDCGGGMEPGSDVERLWQVYYDSQYCRERKNVEAFKRNMPRQDQESAGLRLVQRRRETTLDEFMG